MSDVLVCDIPGATALSDGAVFFWQLQVRDIVSAYRNTIMFLYGRQYVLV